MPRLPQVGSPTRRGLFQLSAGVVTGAILTPAPWRLIKDSSLWSENWPGIPLPARGEIHIKDVACTLCSSACPLKARCVGDQPVSLSGARCPFGVVAHHLPYHPARLRQGPIEEARSKFTARKPDARVAILDLSTLPVSYDLTHPGSEAAWLANPTVPALDSVADASIDYLLIDESSAQTYIPWHEVARTLAPGATVIAFTPSHGGYARHATYALPTPVFPEGSLIPRPPEVITTAEFLSSVSASHLPLRASPEARATNIYLAPWTPLLVSPLMSKLYEESNLRLAPNAVALHPDEARDPFPRATLQTRLGRCVVNVVADPAVPRGAILAGSSPGIRDIVGRNESAKVVSL